MRGNCNMQIIASRFLALPISVLISPQHTSVCCAGVWRDTGRRVTCDAVI